MIELAAAPIIANISLSHHIVGRAFNASIVPLSSPTAESKLFNVVVVATSVFVNTVDLAEQFFYIILGSY